MKAVRLGMLTPSSNTVLEPVTAGMLAGTRHITAHFSRFRVTEISLSQKGLDQFAVDAMLRAAELLADAKADTVAWNGTSASWLGVARDQALCDAIVKTVGIPATTTTLAFHDALRRLGAKRVGLVTPYTDDVQAKIIDVWGKAGFDCSIERHLGLRDNFSFALADEPTIEGMIRAVCAQGCDAVVILCTNMNGARLSAALEQELDVPILDSVAVTLWGSLRVAKADMTALASWGRVFRT